jgi:DNA-binding transcriptional LysR family regulator
LKPVRGVALFVRAGRRLELTDAGRLLRPEAERTLAAAGDAAEVVRRARTLTGGTASLGTFSTAHHLLLPGLVEDFARRHPQVAIRVVGENSSQLADAVRGGRLEAALVALPIDDDGLEVGPVVAQFELVHATAERDRRDRPTTIEQLARTVLVLPEARWGDEDPTRRQLVERAQRAGVAIRPRIEVQHAGAALELAGRGLGDTLVTDALLDASVTPTGSPACHSTRRCTRRSPSSGGATPGSHPPPAHSWHSRRSSSQTSLVGRREPSENPASEPVDVYVPSAGALSRLRVPCEHQCGTV